MPSKDFSDDISALSDDRSGFFGASRRRPKKAGLGASERSSSASSVTSSARRRGGGRGLFGGFSKKWHGPDDVSVADSLCSGVLRGESRDTWGSSTSTGASSSASLGGGGEGRGPVRSASASVASAPTAPLAGGVADFSLEDYRNRGSENSSCSVHSSGPLAVPREDEEGEDAYARREQRKERVKEKLDQYKRDQRQLKQSCAALERQLAQTTAKLKEVDSNSAFKIDTLEGELRETQGGLERVAELSTREASDQSDCIKTLGRKLIRQAHVIKRQKNAVGQYKAQLQAVEGELTRQDQQDGQRADEYCQLRDQCEGVTQQKVQMQRLLQENIEEMMDLKAETELDAKCIMELEFNLQQKEATLDRLTRESGEKALQICTLERELEEATVATEVADEKRRASEAAAAAAREELAGAAGTLEELRRARAASVPGPDGRAASELTVDSAHAEAEAVEDFEAALEAKDATIRSLDDTVQEHEATVKELTSRMVKMSSTYKQDSYLQRKEIAKLKQANAEYALKLRALEKAFKCVSAPAHTGAMLGATMHGAGGMAAGRGGMVGASVHGRSMHAPGAGTFPGSREAKAAAVKARLGQAPYKFPPASRRESKIVVESNFFDDESNGPPSEDGVSSDDGRKGEFPEEC